MITSGPGIDVKLKERKERKKDHNHNLDFFLPKKF